MGGAGGNCTSPTSPRPSPPPGAEKEGFANPPIHSSADAKKGNSRAAPLWLRSASENSYSAAPDAGGSGRTTETYVRPARPV